MPVLLRAISPYSSGTAPSWAVKFLTGGVFRNMNDVIVTGVPAGALEFGTSTLMPFAAVASILNPPVVFAQVVCRLRVLGIGCTAWKVWVVVARTLVPSVKFTCILQRPSWNGKTSTDWAAPAVLSTRSTAAVVPSGANQVNILALELGSEV